MKLAINLQATEISCGRFGELAQKCEKLGFESVLINEHVVLPAVVKTPAYWLADAPVPDYYAHFADPFICLAVAAAQTKTIKIGTGISLTAEHDPIVLAKTLATLDIVSGGRLIYGAGGGWLREELDIMGVSFSRRWDHAVECLRAMKALWTQDVASFDGEFVKFPPVRSYPKPLQKPHIPIHIGAGGMKALSDRGLHLTVAVGDGWMPTSFPPATFKEKLATLKRLCEEAGRDFTKIEITTGMQPGSATRTEIQSLIAEYEDVGVHRLFIIVAGNDSDPDGTIEQTASLMLP